MASKLPEGSSTARESPPFFLNQQSGWQVVQAHDAHSGRFPFYGVQNNNCIPALHSSWRANWLKQPSCIKGTTGNEDGHVFSLDPRFTLDLSFSRSRPR